MKVEICGDKKITEYSPEESIKIKEDLLLLNPAFTNALNYGGYGGTVIPKYNEYFKENDGVLSVPRGYNIPFEATYTDHRFTLEDVEYPPLSIVLRGTQKDAVERYMELRDSGKGVIVLPTGKGKSILGIALSAKLKQRTLVIVHKDDLIDGWKADCKVALGLRPKKVGLIKGKVFRLGQWITLATIQTLSKLNCEQEILLKNYFSMIIVDEFHHSAANIYKLVNEFPAKDRIGLTATDMRNDGLESVLNFYFGDECFRFKETIDDEDIISPKDVIIKIRNSNIVYNPPPTYLDDRGRKATMVKVGEELVFIDSLTYKEKKELVEEGVLRMKSLSYHAVAEAIQENEEFSVMVAEDIKGEYLNGKSCLVFCKEKEHVRTIERVLIENGVPESSIQLYYGDATESKASMKAKAESGECLITIATYAIATEGTNVKKWERLFLAMTFNNAKDTIQAVGRGRRKLEGKTTCVVYDYAHPRVAGARNHISTRERVYREMGFSIPRDTKIKRGF